MKVVLKIKLKLSWVHLTEGLGNRPGSRCWRPPGRIWALPRTGAVAPQDQANAT